MGLKIRTKDRVNINKEEALKEITAEKMTTLTIWVPESLKQEFKIKALRSKTSLTELITKYMKEYVKYKYKEN